MVGEESTGIGHLHSSLVSSQRLIINIPKNNSLSNINTLNLYQYNFLHRLSY
jgi:hypothetical protein